MLTRTRRQAAVNFRLISAPKLIDSVPDISNPDERFDLEVSVLKTLSTATSAEIRAMISDKYSGAGGGARLARDIGISEATACLLRRGDGSLDKAAAYFGYVRISETPWEWRQSASRIAPEQVGYRRWTDAVKEKIRQQIAAGRSVLSIAGELNVPSARLRDIIKRNRLREPVPLPQTERLEDKLAIAAAELRGDFEGARRIRAEIEARKRGGSLSQQMSYMEHLLESPEQRAAVAAIIKEMAE
jgi:hypothetical protein